MATALGFEIGKITLAIPSEVDAIQAVPSWELLVRVEVIDVINKVDVLLTLACVRPRPQCRWHRRLTT